ncbi:MAG: hypothetical protein IT534_04965 [Bauldia sp.]|nr:hypothetical protein [Bauldia sp.]
MITRISIGRRSFFGASDREYLALTLNRRKTIAASPTADRVSSANLSVASGVNLMVDPLSRLDSAARYWCSRRLRVARQPVCLLPEQDELLPAQTGRTLHHKATETEAARNRHRQSNNAAETGSRTVCRDRQQQEGNL